MNSKTTSNSRPWLLGLGVVVVVAAAYFMFSGNSSKDPANQSASADAQNDLVRSAKQWQLRYALDECV